MKVLHVTHGYFPEAQGGIESYLKMTTAALRADGIEVVILAGSMTLAAACQITESEVDGVRVLRLQRDDWYFDHYARSYHPDVSRLFRDLLARERPDVVHLHQWIRLSSDLVSIARELEIRSVITLHDVYTSCPRAFRVDRAEQPCFRELSAASCRECVPRFGHETSAEVDAGIELFRDQYLAELSVADRVLVAMGVTADLLSQTTGVPRDRLQLHDLPYQPRFGAAVASPSDGVVRFGYWGSLTPHKGPQVLLAALRTVVQRATVPVELHLLGPLATDQLRDSLHRQAAGLPVTFHGAFDAVHLRDARLDVGVFPVLCYEAFGLGLAECFELGLPAIVSDIGALAERVGAAGIRVPPGDAVALAEAMLRLAGDPAQRAALAQSIPGPPPAPAAHAVELRSIYAQVLAAPRRPSASVAAERRSHFLLQQRESLAAALRDAEGRRDPG